MKKIPPQLCVAILFFVVFGEAFAQNPRILGGRQFQIDNGQKAIITLQTPSFPPSFLSYTWKLPSTAPPDNTAWIQAGGLSGQVARWDNELGYWVPSNSLFIAGTTLADNVGIGTSTPTHFKLEVGGAAGPAINNTFTLGSTSLRWKDLFVGPNSIHEGNGAGDEAIISYSNVASVKKLNIDADGNAATDAYIDGSGNFSFNGALMPNNAAGTDGQFLKSKGSGTPPLWSDIGSTVWALKGNAGTTPGTNFIGTTDNKELDFVTNGVLRARFNNSDGDTSGAFVPGVGSYTLGTKANPWKDLYISKASLHMVDAGAAPGGKGQHPMAAPSEGILSYDGTKFIFDHAISSGANQGTFASVIISALTPAGVVHNDALGSLSSSFIVNNDISGTAAIADTKLATISTAGKVANSATTAVTTSTPNTIALRDGSGNLTGNIIGNASNVTGVVTEAHGGTNQSAYLTGDLLYASAPNTLSIRAIGLAGDVLRVVGGVPSWSALAGVAVTTLTGTANQVLVNGGVGPVSGAVILTLPQNIHTGASPSFLGLTLSGLSSAGVVHNSPAGVLSTSLIIDADVSVAAAISDTKLATIASVGKVANSATTATSASATNTIVLRDATGNFSAGTITASLTGNVSGTAASVTGVVNEIHGGTNQITYATGDMLYASASNTISKLPIGTAGKVLTVVGTTPSWQAPVSITFKGRIATSGGLAQVINDANITATSTILVSYEDPAGGGNVTVYVSARVAGVSFTTQFGAAPPAGSFLNYAIIN